MYQNGIFPKGVFKWNYRRLEKLIIMTTNIKLVVIAEDGGNYQKLCGEQ